jgi:hypothetical protein
MILRVKKTRVLKNELLIEHKIVTFEYFTGMDTTVRKKAQLRPALNQKNRGVLFFTLPLIVKLQKHNRPVEKRWKYLIFNAFLRNPVNKKFVVTIYWNKNKNMQGLSVGGAKKFIYQNRHLFTICHKNLKNLIDATVQRFGSVQNLELLHDFLKRETLLYTNDLFLSNPYLVLCGWETSKIFLSAISFVDYKFGYMNTFMCRLFALPNSFNTPTYTSGGKLRKSPFLLVPPGAITKSIIIGAQKFLTEV